jgi:hypothetical protein
MIEDAGGLRLVKNGWYIRKVLLKLTFNNQKNYRGTSKIFCDILK